MTWKLVAGWLPNLTAVVPVNPEPETVTVVPPGSGPKFGWIALTTGALPAGPQLPYCCDQVVPPFVVW